MKETTPLVMKANGLPARSLVIATLSMVPLIAPHLSSMGSATKRSSVKPINQKPTAAFKDGMKKGMELEPQGDPGAYDPYTNSDLVASASFTHNKTSKPFMATSTRELAMTRHMRHTRSTIPILLIALCE